MDLERCSGSAAMCVMKPENAGACGATRPARGCRSLAAGSSSVGGKNPSTADCFAARDKHASAQRYFPTGIGPESWTGRRPFRKKNYSPFERHIAGRRLNGIVGSLKVTWHEPFSQLTIIADGYRILLPPIRVWTWKFDHQLLICGCRPDAKWIRDSEWTIIQPECCPWWQHGCLLIVRPIYAKSGLSGRAGIFRNVERARVAVAGIDHVAAFRLTRIVILRGFAGVWQHLQ